MLTAYAVTGALVCRPCETVVLAAVAATRVGEQKSFLVGRAIVAGVVLVLLAGLILLAR